MSFCLGQLYLLLFAILEIETVKNDNFKMIAYIKKWIHFKWKIPKVSAWSLFWKLVFLKQRPKAWKEMKY